MRWQGEEVQPATEREWVGRARDGDRAAFTALVDLYWDRIRRWVYSLTRDAARAEDLTQDTFVKAWIGLPGLETPATFRSWLFRIARNLALDSRKGPRGVAPQALPEALPGREAEPLERLVEREDQARLRKAVDALPAAYRAAYLLWVHEEMPYPDIARILEVSEETVRWRVCKARQTLAKALAPDRESPR